MLGESKILQMIKNVQIDFFLLVLLVWQKLGGGSGPIFFQKLGVRTPKPLQWLRPWKYYIKV